MFHLDTEVFISNCVATGRTVYWVHIASSSFSQLGLHIDMVSNNSLELYENKLIQHGYRDSHDSVLTELIKSK